MKQKIIYFFLTMALVFGTIHSVQAIEEKSLNDNKNASATPAPTASTATPETNKSSVQDSLDKKVEAADKKAEANGAKVKCHLTYTLKTWSIFYKSGKGEGSVSCDNGETANVQIRAHGGGVAFGKSNITDGKGSFSKVASINELYGSYASSEADGGVVKSGDVRAMTKGSVSLAVHGTGSGVDMGIAFGAFKITPM